GRPETEPPCGFDLATIRDYPIVCGGARRIRAFAFARVAFHMMRFFLAALIVPLLGLPASAQQSELPPLRLPPLIQEEGEVELDPEALRAAEEERIEQQQEEGEAVAQEDLRVSNPVAEFTGVDKITGRTITFD